MENGFPRASMVGIGGRHYVDFTHSNSIWARVRTIIAVLFSSLNNMCKVEVMFASGHLSQTK